MGEVVIPLSSGNIRKLTQSLKVLAGRYRDEIPVQIEQQTCDVLAAEVRDNIASIADLDGNYLGGENPNAAVSVEVGLVGHEVIWRGKQIAFLEFGTGAAGANGLVSTPAMHAAGYYPDPSKDWWLYPDRKTGTATWSHGIPPYAPMYMASMLLRSRVLIAPAQATVKEAWNRAVTL